LSPEPVRSRRFFVALAEHRENYGRGILRVVEHLLVGRNELGRNMLWNYAAGPDVRWGGWIAALDELITD
jgi:hypothetical protein